MNTYEVLTVMRDHTKVTGSGAGVLCVCGHVSWTAFEHTEHVAERIAAASTGGSRPAVPQPRLVPAGELTEAHVGLIVTVPARDHEHGAGSYEGALVAAELWPPDRAEHTEHAVLVELLHPGDGHTSGYVVPPATWIEVHP